MTMIELSRLYAADADRVRVRIRQLREQEKLEPQPEAAYRLHQRLLSLLEIQRDLNATAEWTARYYDPGYCQAEEIRI